MSRPNGNWSSARDAPIFNAAASKTEATVAYPEIRVMNSMQTSRKYLRRRMPRALLLDDFEIGQTGPERKMHCKKEIPADTAAGIFRSRGQCPISGPAS